MSHSRQYSPLALTTSRNDKKTQSKHTVKHKTNPNTSKQALKKMWGTYKMPKPKLGIICKSAFACISVSLWTTIVHNTAPNGSDNLPSYLPDSQRLYSDRCVGLAQNCANLVYKHHKYIFFKYSRTARYVNTVHRQESEQVKVLYFTRHKNSSLQRRSSKPIT